LPVFRILTGLDFRTRISPDFQPRFLTWNQPGCQSSTSLDYPLGIQLGYPRENRLDYPQEHCSGYPGENRLDYPRENRPGWRANQLGYPRENPLRCPPENPSWSDWRNATSAALYQVTGPLDSLIPTGTGTWKKNELSATVLRIRIRDPVPF
jgi:hypothetical protein